MINSVDEFIDLRTSDKESDIQRAMEEPAADEIWWELLEKHAELAMWVAENETIPEDVIRTLRNHYDQTVRRILNAHHPK